MHFLWKRSHMLIQRSESIFDVQSGQFVFYLSKHFEYKDVINKARKDMQADGTIDRLTKKWNLDF